MSADTFDLIDQLVGIAPGSPLDAIRRSRAVARENSQKAYEALFDAAEPGPVTRAERLAVARFVAGLHRNEALARHYARRLEAEGGAAIAAAIAAETERAATEGPYGAYPEGPLSPENRPGPVYEADQNARRLLGDRLARALEHAHLLVFRPREASPEALDRLLEAGWSTDAVVTLSQLVAFLAYQIRLVEGLSALAAANARHQAA